MSVEMRQTDKLKDHISLISTELFIQYDIYQICTFCHRLVLFIIFFFYQFFLWIHALPWYSNVLLLLATRGYKNT